MGVSFIFNKLEESRVGGGYSMGKILPFPTIELEFGTQKRAKVGSGIG